jgi:hypothetical protein
MLALRLRSALGERGANAGYEFLRLNRGRDHVAPFEHVLPRGVVSRRNLDDERRPGAAQPERLQHFSRLGPLQAEARDHNVGAVGDRAPVRPGQRAML